MTNVDFSNDAHLEQVIDRLRDFLIDKSLSNRLLNFKHNERSNTHIRIVDRSLVGVCKALSDDSIRLEFLALPEEQDLADEKSEEFLKAYDTAILSDLEYLNMLKEAELAGIEDPDFMFEIDRELRDRIRIQLGLPPRVDVSQASPTERAEAFGINPSYELSASDTDLSANSRIVNLQTMALSSIMQARLAKINHAARTSIEESGVNRLFAAVGFLEWYATDASDVPLYAPLILIPVKLERESRQNRWSYFLSSNGDAAVSNKALIIRLSQEHNLDIDDIAEDAVEIDDYLETVANAVKNNPKWRVHRSVTVGLFAFAKIAQYQDLDPGNWVDDYLIGHPTIQSIYGGEDLPDGYSSDLDINSLEMDIDALESKKELPPLILGADSSQTSAIVEALSGNNLAIKGPPGTGKSQTIANLIAAAMYQNKTVLFLSEKMAALEVVKSRLDEVELGKYVLELHSSKARMRNVISSLNERWEDQNKIDSSYEFAREGRLNDLEQIKTQLNEYCSVLNTHHGFVNKTVHEIIWHYENSRHMIDGTEFSELVIDNCNILTQNHIDDARDALNRYKHSYDAVFSDGNVDTDGGIIHPWSWVKKPLNRLDQETLAVQLRQYIDLTEAVAALEDNLREIGINSEFTGPRDLIEALEAIDKLPTLKESVNVELLQNFEASTDIDDFVNLLAKSRDLRTNTVALSDYVDPTIGLGHLRELDDLKKAVAETYLNADLRIESLQDKIVSIDKEVLSVNEAILTVENIGEKCSIAHLSNQSIEIIDIVMKTCELVSELSESANTARNKTLSSPDAHKYLTTAQDTKDQLLTSKGKLDERFILSDLPDVETLRAISMTIKTTGLLKKLGSRYRDAKRSFRAFYRATVLRSGDNAATPMEMVEELEYLIQHLDGVNSFLVDKTLRDLTGNAWNGLGTDITSCIEASEFLTKVMEISDGTEGVLSRLANSLTDGSKETLSQIGLVYKNSGPALDSLCQQLNDCEHRTLADKRDLLIAQSSWCQKLWDISDKAGLDSKVSVSQLSDVCDKLANRSSLIQDITSHESSLSLLSECNLDLNSDDSSISDTLEFAINAKSTFGSLKNLDWLDAVYSRDVKTVRNRLAQVGEQIHAILESELGIYRNISDLSEIGDQPDNITSDSIRLDFSVVKYRFQHSLSKFGSLANWCQYLQSVIDCKTLALSDFTHVYERNCHIGLIGVHISDTFLGDAFSATFWKGLVKSAVSEYPVLWKFSGIKQEQLRDRYRDLDAQILKLSAGVVRSKLSRLRPPAGVKQGRVGTWTEMSLINHMLPQTRPVAKIRDVLLRAPKSIQKLKPCFMMSPNSVAQFLDPNGLRFDLLIIDEASQMRPEEAIGAIARCSNSVIVGDQMQLPPTSFFDRMDSEDVDDELQQDLGADESILDKALQSFPLQRQLRWHYRSNHHDLIKFSNKHFYNNRLIVFPSPSELSDNELGVRYHKVEATYLGHGANPEEAKHVAVATIKALKDNPKWSIGVVALNKTQADLINTEVDHLLLKDREARRIWDSWSDTLMPCFIKNLENVQGDERDQIIISTVYGPDSSGKVMNRFGPITLPNGHRRLNVLITRAKNRVDIYSSMVSSDIRTDEKTSMGVQILKQYLSFAATGQLETGEITSREPDSDFEIAVAEVLIQAGYQVVAQVGAGGFFIDIGVKHPSYPHGFLAGIECDGATYHSARSARDRDILRQAVLEDLGWTIHRVWSTDWFNNPEKSKQDLLEFLSNQVAKRKNRSHDKTIDNSGALADASGDLFDGYIDSNDTDEILDHIVPIQTALEEEIETDTSHIADDSNPRVSYKEMELREAYRKLYEIRELQIIPKYPLAEDRNRGLLRRSMLTSLLSVLPSTVDEFNDRMPKDLVIKTDPNQIHDFLEIVLGTIRRYKSSIENPDIIR